MNNGVTSFNYVGLYKPVAGISLSIHIVIYTKLQFRLAEAPDVIFMVRKAGNFLVPPV